MAKDVIVEIKKLFEAGKVILGQERTMKLVKTGGVKRVFTSKNCKADVCQDVKRFAELAGVQVVELPLSSDEVGALCRKQFGVSILGVTE
ncbi:MAG: ribosomal L7Ae/L30e/S12e/Gadd45 family protein [Nanoarchaeota archaeon]